MHTEDAAAAYRLDKDIYRQGAVHLLTTTRIGIRIELSVKSTAHVSRLANKHEAT